MSVIAEVWKMLGAGGSGSGKRTILIADEDSGFWNALSDRFDADQPFEVVGRVNGPADLSRFGKELSPAVIALDLAMLRQVAAIGKESEQGIPDALRRLRKEHPRSRVLLVHAEGDSDDEIRLALASGASGVISKTLPRDHFVSALAVFDPDMMDRMLHNSRG